MKNYFQFDTRHVSIVQRSSSVVSSLTIAVWICTSNGVTFLTWYISFKCARHKTTAMRASLNTWHSLGANVRNITPVGISYWKQVTSLEVLRGPQMTRKILLPVLQLAPRLFRGYYKNGLMDSAWKRGWGIKVLNTLLPVDKTKPNDISCKKHNVGSVGLCQYDTSLVTWLR